MLCDQLYFLFYLFVSLKIQNPKLLSQCLCVLCERKNFISPASLEAQSALKLFIFSLWLCILCERIWLTFYLSPASLETQRSLRLLIFSLWLRVLCERKILTSRPLAYDSRGFVFFPLIPLLLDTGSFQQIRELLNPWFKVFKIKFVFSITENAADILYIFRALRKYLKQN